MFIDNERLKVLIYNYVNYSMCYSKIRSFNLLLNLFVESTLKFFTKVEGTDIQQSKFLKLHNTFSRYYINTSTHFYMLQRSYTIITFQAIDWFLGIYAISWFENQLIAWTMIMFSHFASYQILQQIMRCSSKLLALVLKEIVIDITRALPSP